MARPIAVPTMPDSASGVSSTRFVAELGLQALGHPEDAAERADVLAHEQHLGVVAERLAQAGVDRLGHGQVSSTVVARSLRPAPNDAS